MSPIIRLVSKLLIILLIAGCATPASIQPNATTADELLNRLGKPTSTRSAPGGGEFWEYAYGPQGTQTWLYRIDSGRMVRSAEQLLTVERLHRVVPGETTQAQVRELLGEPRKMRQLREEMVWEWRVDLAPNLGVFVARFDANGRATGINVLVDISPDSRDKDSTK